MIILIPANGRDYKTAKSVLADWNAGMAFRTVNSLVPVHQAHMIDAEETLVVIRYDNLTKSVSIEMPEQS